VNEYQTKGEHHFTFDAIYLPAGVYFYQLRVNGGIETKKMILME